MEWLWPARQPFLASGHQRLGTMKTETSCPPNSLLLPNSADPISVTECKVLAPASKGHADSGPCYREHVVAISFMLYHFSFWTLKLLQQGESAVHCKANVNRGLLLRARGNVIQKQFEGNCKVMWPREPEAIETLNIISGQYNMLCRAAWKTGKPSLANP